MLRGLKCGAQGTLNVGRRTTLGQRGGEVQVKDAGRLVACRGREESALTHRFLA